MKDQDTLLKAIDYYGLLSGSTKALLKKLIQLQEDSNEVIVTRQELIKFLKISHPTLSNNLIFLRDHNFIEADLRQGKRLSSILIKPTALTKIVDHYLSRKDLK